MVKWSSLTPQLDQQPTTPAIRATFSATETAPALVKLMENGLGAHLLVNVSEYILMSSLLNLIQLKLVYKANAIKFLRQILGFSIQTTGTARGLLARLSTLIF